MATTFKNFLNNDSTNTRTLLHESIPLTGSIVSGTYIADTELNIKNYAHGMFQSVYDYPYLSSSANHIFDITCGFSASSGLSGAAGEGAGKVATQQAKKINLYNQMAQMMVGYDPTGSSIRGFDQDGNLAGGSSGLQEVFFLSFARLLSKDEIKKGSFTIQVYTGSGCTNGAGPYAVDDGAVSPTGTLTVGDYQATTNYRVNSPAGEYGILYTASTTPRDDGLSGVGLIYYQAGIVVLTSSIFSSDPLGINSDAPNKSGSVLLGSDGIEATVAPHGTGSYFGSSDTGSATVWEGFASQSISGCADGLRNRLKSISFNNTTELNSTIYFCRANHNEFNYSSNPTYLSASKMVVKNNSTDLPVSYMTTIGLYSADNELLAMAKLSEPLKKDPNTELTLRVRLDY